jgi:hypothetical protein
MTTRAPWPDKPPRQVARSLREALAMSWTNIRHSEPALAFSELEAAVLYAVCDLESHDLAGWQQTYAQLEEARPK